MAGPYLRSKWQAEQAAVEAIGRGVPVIIARPSIPVGPGDRRLGPLSHAICQFAAGRIGAVVAGVLDVADVRDLAEGIVAAARRGAIGRRYLLTGQPVTYMEFFTALAPLVGRPPPRRVVPYPLALAFAHVNEWVCRHWTGSRPLASVTGVRLTRRSFHFNSRRTRCELGLVSRPFRAALSDAVAWFRAHAYIPPLDATTRTGHPCTPDCQD